jgi:hypothetical protein
MPHFSAIFAAFVLSCAKVDLNHSRRAGISAALQPFELQARTKIGSAGAFPADLSQFQPDAKSAKLHFQLLPGFM